MEHPSLNLYPGFGIKDFLSHLAGDDKAIICVYDYSIPLDPQSGLLLSKQ